MTGDPITDIQAAVIERLTGGFHDRNGRSRLRKVDQIEVPFDGATAKKIRITPPAIYLTPLMIRPGTVSGEIDIQWAVYCMSDRASPAARTTGGAAPMGIGVYAITHVAALLLDDWSPEVEGASRFRLVGGENLTGLSLFADGLNCWALTFASCIERELGNVEPLIAPFEVVHFDIDVPPFEDLPEELPAARDAAFKVELEQ